MTGSSDCNATSLLLEVTGWGPKIETVGRGLAVDGDDVQHPTQGTEFLARSRAAGAEQVQKLPIHQAHRANRQSQIPDSLRHPTTQAVELLNLG